MRGELWALLAPEGGTDQAGVCICGGGRVGARGEKLQNAVKSGGMLCGERSYLAVGGHIFIYEMLVMIQPVSCSCIGSHGDVSP